MCIQEEVEPANDVSNLVIRILSGALRRNKLDIARETKSLALALAKQSQPTLPVDFLDHTAQAIEHDSWDYVQYKVRCCDFFGPDGQFLLLLPQLHPPSKEKRLAMLYGEVQRPLRNLTLTAQTKSLTRFPIKIHMASGPWLGRSLRNESPSFSCVDLDHAQTSFVTFQISMMISPTGGVQNVYSGLFDQSFLC